MNGMMNVRGLPKSTVIIMVAGAALTVCVACTIAVLIFILALTGKTSKSAITSTAKAEAALAAAQTETARPMVTPKPKEPPVPTDTSVPPTDIPIATVTAQVVTVTPVPDELRREAEATYKRIVFIQLNAEDLAEIARERAAVEISSLEAELARGRILALIQLVEQDIVDEAPPPADLESAWGQSLRVHEETKAICVQWVNEETGPSEVAERLGSVLDRAGASVQESAQVLIVHYGLDTTSVEKLRQQTVQEIRQMIYVTPTP